MSEPPRALERPDRCYNGEFSAADVLDGTLDFSLFTALLERVPRLKALAEDRQTNATWFVPTNAGIEATLRGRNTTLSQIIGEEGLLAEILAGHVVPRALPHLQNLKNTTKLATLGGGERTLVHSGRSFRFAAAFPFFDLGGDTRLRSPSNSAGVGQPRGACKAVIYPLDELLWP